MAHTHRLVVVYRPCPPRPTEDPQTYWASFDELLQLVEDILSHDEDAVHGGKVQQLLITPFGDRAGLQRERLFDETGY